MNMLHSNVSYGSGEAWEPLCLPRFNANAFVYVYMVYLDEKITLTIISTDKEAFHDVSEWKSDLTLVK